ncbi:hypothetical protein V6N12_029023 [Hibiscus sabdariffa]|uniref:NADH dehydrogenase subunit 2 n=1 Tax=Hibiscus sabdariffa TaxID=183260 RepID=A0ABR2F7H8_9ROSI
MSSILPSGCTYERSANYSIIVVGLALPIPSFLKTDLGIRLMLAPGSHKALPTYWFPMEKGMVKLPGSIILVGTLLYIIAKHASVAAVISSSPILVFLDTMSLRNLA